MVDPAWDSVYMPGNLRNQFREQFGARLYRHMLQDKDRFEDLSVSEVLHAFDVADEHIGRHWPLIATNLWRYGSHTLISAYCQTSGTILDALKGILSTSTALYPVFTTKANMTKDGMIVASRPTYELSARHWSIFQYLSVLAQTDFFKRSAKDTVKDVHYHITVPLDEYSEAFRKISKSKITFGVDLEDSFTFYPMDFLQTRIGHSAPELNRLLYFELQNQTRLPQPDDDVMNELKRKIFQRFPALMRAEEAAESVNISRSSLQRLLRKKNTSYSEIVQDLRREFVLVYLAKLKTDQVDHTALGFPSSRALNSFCKTAFGKSLSVLAKRSA